MNGATRARRAMTTPSRRGWLLSAVGLALAGLAERAVRAQPPAAARTALVIGNSHYPQSVLANPGNDAALVSSTLKSLGFDVRLVLDAGNASLLDAVRGWLARSTHAEVRMLYFAGHGAQYRGRNFLIPIDAHLRSEDDLPGSAFSVDDLSDRLSRFETGLNVVVLDACRSAPTLAPEPGTRLRGAQEPAWTPGFTAAVAPRGTLIAYSTSPGALAADDPRAGNSAYTRHLVAALRTPGLSIEAVFKRTRAAVLRESGGTQMPWESSSLVGDFCFSTTPSGGCDKAR